jgi:hypothetical protein
MNADFRLSSFAALLLVGAGCSAEASQAPAGSSSGGTNAGGNQNAAGTGAGGTTTATGGTSAAAGTVGIGGTTPATGGAGGTATSTGGTTPATGGAGGTTTATGGTSTATGGTGGTAASTPLYTFDTTLQGFTVHAGATPADLSTSAVAVWSDVQGHPDPGAASLTIPFTAPDQRLQFAVNFDTTDMTGKTLTVQVMFESGPAADTTGGGGVKLYAKSGAAYVYADGGYNAIPAIGTWVTATLNLAAPSYTDTVAGTFAPNDIRELGVEIDTGSTGTYTTAVVFIDTFAD